MFVNKIYNREMEAISKDRGPMYRAANVGWASEGHVNLGPYHAGKCQRAFFYSALGEKPTNPMGLRLKRICESGCAHEDQIIQKFKDMDMYLSDQARIEYTMPNTANNVIMSGKIDVLIRDDNGLKIGIEIKSVAGYGADMVFGRKNKKAMPKANNLMQAMLYKYYSINNKIDGHKIDKIFLMYVDRADSTNIFFEINIDENGYPIITPYYMDGTEGMSLVMSNMKSFDELNNTSDISSSEECSLAELRININDVFKSYDDTYSYIRQAVIPPKSFSLEYTDEEAEQAYRCGKITKLRFEKHRGITLKGSPTKNIEKCGDFACSFCDYKTKCLEDSGIKFN